VNLSSLTGSSPLFVHTRRAESWRLARRPVLHMQRLKLLLLLVLSHAVRSGRFPRPSFGKRKREAQPAPAPTDDCERPQRCLFLISDTGGGHRQSANALKSAMLERAPAGSIEIEIVDIFTDYGAWPHNRLVGNYQKCAAGCGAPRLGWFWRMVWRLCYFGSAPFEHGWAFESWITCGRGFKRCLEKHKPDLVVSLHPLTQHLPLRLLTIAGKRAGARGRTVPFATVCTDLGSAHRAWFDRRVDAIFVPCEALQKAAMRRGVDEKKVFTYGLPVREAFWNPSAVHGTPIDTATARLRQRQAADIGLRHDKKTVLIIGGGGGVGGLSAIVEAVAERLAEDCPGEGQVVALCGKNARLFQKLEKRRPAWEAYGVSFEVRSFTSQVSDYMEIADCLVTKAGPGTIAEAAIRSLPTMLSSFLPGQEAGNVPFVVDRGFGEFSRDPSDIARRVVGWVQDDEALQRMSANARDAAMPDATMSIAEHLLRMLPRQPS
jgi:1,2-diacylglycerol 3-beta-galactosyltransferase